MTKSMYLLKILYLAKNLFMPRIIKLIFMPVIFIESVEKKSLYSALLSISIKERQ